MSKLKTMSAVLVAATTLTLASVGNAQAAVITTVSTTTNMGGTNANRISNNSGLSTPDSLSATHSASNPFGNSWQSALGTTTGDVTFGLGGLYRLNTMSVWNVSGSLLGLRNTGMRAVNILTSLDGLTFTALKSVVFNQGNNGLLPAPQVAQGIALDNSLASFVRFNVVSNYGSAIGTGLSGAKFDGTAVPTPALLPGLAGMGIAAFRKRRNKAAKTVAA